MARRARSRAIRGSAVVVLLLSFGVAGGTASSGCGSDEGPTGSDAASESNDERVVVSRDALPDDQQRPDATALSCAIVFKDPFTSAWDPSWKKRAPSAGTSVEVASGVTRSPPTALHVSVNDDSGIGAPGAALTRDIRPDAGADGLTGKCVAMRFAMNVSACDSIACIFAALAPRSFSSAIVFAFLAGKGVGLAVNDNVTGCALCKFAVLKDETGKTLMNPGPSWYDVSFGVDARSTPTVASLEVRSGDKTWRASLAPEAVEGLALDVLELEVAAASPGNAEVWFDDFSLGSE